MRITNELSEKQLLDVKIKDSGEELVEINKYAPSILIHKSLTKNHGSKPLVRKTIAKMLNKAKTFLPPHITIIVRDAYRPISIQRTIYSQFLNRLRKQNPKWPAKKLKAETNKYVADPDSLIIPGHTTGAAVDVSLAYVKNGRRLAMKTKKLSNDNQTKLEVPKLPKNILKNRKLLYTAMIKAGFINYPYEWWHYSYGDVFAVARTGGKTAIFGPINLK